MLGLDRITLPVRASSPSGSNGELYYNSADGKVYQYSGVASAFRPLLTEALASTTYAPLASPTFTGTVTIPTAAITTLSGTPNFSGAATGQTAGVGTNTTQLATTAYVMADFVRLTTAQTIAGVKTFSSVITPTVNNGIEFPGNNATIFRIGNEMGVATGDLIVKRTAGTGNVQYTDGTTNRFTLNMTDGTVSASGNVIVGTNRWYVAASNGALNWGPGDGSWDISLSRPGVGVLALNGSLTAAGTYGPAASRGRTGIQGTNAGAGVIEMWDRISVSSAHGFQSFPDPGAGGIYTSGVINATGLITAASGLANQGAYVGQASGATAKITMISGTSSNTGYVEWWNTSGNRLGYLGFDNTNLTLSMESGADFRLQQAAQTRATATSLATFIGGSSLTFSASISQQLHNQFGAPNYSGNAAGRVITDAATIAIAGSPAAGNANMTITNAYSLWVQAGSSRFDSYIQIPGASNFLGIRMGASAAKATQYEYLQFWNATDGQDWSIYRPASTRDLRIYSSAPTAGDVARFPAGGGMELVIPVLPSSTAVRTVIDTLDRSSFVKNPSVINRTVAYDVVTANTPAVGANARMSVPVNHSLGVIPSGAIGTIQVGGGIAFNLNIEMMNGATSSTVTFQIYNPGGALGASTIKIALVTWV